MNNTSRRKKKQHFQHLNPMPDSKIALDLINWVKSLPVVKRKVLNILFHLDNRFSELFPSQKEIAKSIGCSRKHVNTTMAEFEQDGIILMQYRHMTSDIYKVSSFFKNQQIRELLKRYFSAFMYFSLSCLQVEVTQVTVKESIFISLFRNERVTLGHRSREAEWEYYTKREILMEAKEALGLESLTQQQLLALSEYSYDTIQFAIISYRQNKDHVENPFAYLLSVCKKRHAQCVVTTQSPLIPTESPQEGNSDVKVLPKFISAPREDIGSYEAPPKKQKPITAEQNYVQRERAEERYRQAELPLLERVKIENRAKQAAWLASRSKNEVSS
jgi:biotin operon repressor